MAARCFLILAAALVMVAASPAAAQTAYVIQHARVVTVSGPTLPDGSVVIKDGKIADVGRVVAVPAGAKIIDGRGLTVYPGLFDPDSNLGMSESNPESQFGPFTPHLNASTSFVAESERIPVTRVAGVTHVLARPVRGVIPGQGEIMNLAGRTGEEMLVKPRAAMLLVFPTVGELQYTEDERFRVTPWSLTRPQFERELARLEDFFSRAREYMTAKDRQADVAPDASYEAMIPVLRRREPVIIETANHVDIRNAVQFAKEQNLDYVIGAQAGAWRVADFLKANGARVLLCSAVALPDSEDDPYDIVYRTAAILHEKGVPFAFSTLSNRLAYPRELPYAVGRAVTYGLPHDVAVRALTLTPAEFLGVADKVGSIDKGKIANLVVAAGDIFERFTPIKYVFVNGQPASLRTKEMELYEQYRNRTAPAKKGKEEAGVVSTWGGTSVPPVRLRRTLSWRRTSVLRKWRRP